MPDISSLYDTIKDITPEEWVGIGALAFLAGFKIYSAYRHKHPKGSRYYTISYREQAESRAMTEQQRIIAEAEQFCQESKHAIKLR